MPKNNTPSNPIYIEEFRIMLHTVMEQSRETGETTTHTDFTVQELRQQFLALLARPEEQELGLGRSLEQALTRMLERLEGIEFRQSHLVTSQKALDDRLAKLEAGQATILTHLGRLSGLTRPMQQMAFGQEQLMSMIREYLVDPFPPADLPRQ